MKRSKYTDEPILAIVKEGEAGRKVGEIERLMKTTRPNKRARRHCMDP